MPFFRRRHKQMTPLERARHIAVVHNAGERGDYKRPWTRPPSGRPQLVNPTEPCPICLEVVGLPTSEGWTEQWGSLPCGHKFGMRCLKVWLGTNQHPTCPLCKVNTFHTCEHPPLPRLSEPPKFDPTDVQPDQEPPVRHPNPIPADPAPDPAPEPAEEPVEEPAAEPEVEPVPEPEGQQEVPEEYPRVEHVENPVDEAVECNQDKASSSCQPGPGRLSPKNSVRVFAEPSLHNEPQEGPAPRDNISEVVDEEPEVAAPAPAPAPAPVNNEQPVVVPPPAPVVPIAPAAPVAQDAPEPAQQQPAPPFAAPQPVVAPVEAPAPIPVVADPISHDFAPMAQPNNVNVSSNSIRISWRHRHNILHRKRNFAKGEKPVAPQPPQPITIETEQDYDTLSYMMQYYPYKMPTFMAMAYPRKVDLNVPCAYCYMKIQLPRPDPKEKHPKPTPYARSSRLPVKKCIVQSGKYAGYFGGYAWSGFRFVLRATFCSPAPLSKPNEREQQLLDAYWTSWRTVHSSTFEEWWAKQEPCTEEPRVPSPPPEEEIDLVFEAYEDWGQV